MKACVTWIAIVASFVPINVFGASATEYDRNGDSRISVDEFKRFALDRIGPSISELDADGNGILTVDEVEQANLVLRSLDDEIDVYMEPFVGDHSENGQEIHEFAKKWRTDDWQTLQPKSRLGSLPIKLRASHEDISHTNSGKPISKAKPAQIAFTRDIKADNEILALNGTLMWPLQLNRDAGLLGVPSISLNRVSNDKEPEKDTDSLVFRFGLDLERDAKNGGLYYWRLNPTFTTDTDFDLDIRGAELQFETSSMFPGSGQMIFSDNETIGFRWRGIIHTEFGKVEDNAGNAALIVGESFSRAGIKLNGLFALGRTDRFSLDIDWEYLARIGGDLRDRKLFAATLGYKIDENGHFQFQTTYANGDKSAALEDQELWTVGLGVRF